MKKEERDRLKKEEKAAETARMRELFKEIWDERQDEKGMVRCFETDVLMRRDRYRENSAVYHHVLEKNDRAYPQYKFNKQNIVIILPSIHASVGINTPRIDKLRKELLSLHYENKLEEYEKR